jgi:hypothetical protein
MLPCIGMCGLIGVQQAFKASAAKELKVKGEQFLAALDGGTAPPVPEHFTYRPLDDGGFVLYFPEPSFPLPTDFFYVWDGSEKRWVLREFAELPGPELP